MEESTALEKGRELVRKIHQQPGWYEGIDVGRSAQWFGRALSALALLGGDEDPQYVTGDFNGAAGAGSLHIFYARSLATVELSGGHEDEPQLVVTARPRTGLLSLEVSTTVALGSNRQWEQGTWPGRVQAVATYENGLSLTLPVSPTGNDARNQELADFIPSLRADLEN